MINFDATRKQMGRWRRWGVHYKKNWILPVFSRVFSKLWCICIYEKSLELNYLHFSLESFQKKHKDFLSTPTIWFRFFMNHDRFTQESLPHQGCRSSPNASLHFFELFRSRSQPLIFPLLGGSTPILKLSNEKRAPGCLGDLLGMKWYPVMWGVFHRHFIDHEMRIPNNQPV